MTVVTMSPETRPERRIVSAWLPHWPMEVWQRAETRRRAAGAPPSSPFGPDGRREGRSPPEEERDLPRVLIAPTARGDVLHGVDAAAAALGLGPGQRATDVMAAHADLAVAYADPAAEAVSLKRLAAWARRWSPHVRADGADGIALDTTGCDHLHGGERAMLADMRARLAGLGVTARLAVAPSHAAAHALARHAADAEPVVAKPRDVTAALAPLPVAALRIDPESALLLARLGLRTIGQLAAIPRPALKKRFSARRRRDPRDETWEDYLGRATDRSGDVLARLDEALGRAARPLDPEREEPRPRVAVGLTEAVMETDAVLASLRAPVEALCADLERCGRGARTVLIEAFRTDGGRSETTLRLSRPTRDARHVMRLLVDRLEGWRAEFGYDALAVEALQHEPVAADQHDVETRSDAPDPHALIDRLRARLGGAAVLAPRPLASHWPERAEDWLPAGEGAGSIKTLAPAGADGPVAWTDGGASPPPRPERLLDHPEPVAVIHAVPDGPPARFTWRRVAHDVAAAAGPERIAPEWWRERAGARSRDYWRVETREGRRLWLYREGFEGDERIGPPRWFVHGLFA